MSVPGKSEPTDRSKNRSSGLTACATSRSMRRDVRPAGSAEKVIVKKAMQNEANPFRRFIRSFFMLISFCECLLNNGVRDGASRPPAGSPRHSYRRVPRSEEHTSELQSLRHLV